MSTVSHLPVVKDDLPRALFSLSYHELAPSSLLEHSKGVPKQKVRGVQNRPEARHSGAIISSLTSFVTILLAVSEMKSKGLETGEAKKI